MPERSPAKPTILVREGESLPTATVELLLVRAVVQVAATEDVEYVCMRTAAGTYAWIATTGETFASPVTVEVTSLTAFQVADAGGNTALIVDTTNREIQIENGGLILMFADGSTSLSGNVTINLDGSAGTIQLLKGPTIFAGTGSPETVVTASKGSIYLNMSGGAGTSLYVKESGAGSTNTGWVGK